MSGDKQEMTWTFVSACETPHVRNHVVERIQFADAKQFWLQPSAIVGSDSSIQEQMVYWAFEMGRFCPVEPVQIMCLQNAILLREGIVFTEDGECIIETIHPWTPNNIFHRFGSLLNRLPSAHAIREKSQDFLEIDEIIHLREPGETGYFHWINSVLPRIALLDRVSSLSRAPVAVDCSTLFAQQSLKLMGIESDRLVQGYDGLRIKRLWLMTPTNLRGDHFTRHPFWTQELRRRLTPSGRSGSGRRIYVSRNDSKVRRIVNEDEVAFELRQHGFEFISATGMSMIEQIDLFSSAELLISPHGAGLSNAIFMPTGCVIEIVSRSRLWPTFRTLAARCGLDYAAYISSFQSSPDKPKIDVGNEDIQVSIGEFRSFMNEINSIFIKNT